MLLASLRLTAILYCVSTHPGQPRFQCTSIRLTMSSYLAVALAVADGSVPVEAELACHERRFVVGLG